MAALLSCGDGAVLSHESAAALWRIRARTGKIEVSVDRRAARTSPDIRVHRRKLQPREIRHHRGIPVTSPVCTIIDLAARLNRTDVERMIDEADIQGLANPDQLRNALDTAVRRPGVAILRRLLDRRSFRLARSRLERRFMPIAKAAGLPIPETRAVVNGFEVDFYWRDVGLVVETDSLTYHRTPAKQAKDRVRDQTHTAAGLTHLRFTHAQIAFQPGYVEAMLARVARRLKG
jgi:very-short-patch-repair endonuclease